MYYNLRFCFTLVFESQVAHTGIQLNEAEASLELLIPCLSLSGAGMTDTTCVLCSFLSLDIVASLPYALSVLQFLAHPFHSWKLSV